MLLAVFVLIFPFALMGLAVGMDLLERQVTLEGLRHGLGLAFLAEEPDAVESYVARGFAPTVDHYWSRRRRTDAR